MIVLKNLTPFARGSRRQCYISQDNMDHCIKIILPERPPELIRQKSKFYKKVLKPSHFNENLNEIKGHYFIPFYEHFPVCFDTVNTDLGEGLVVELIRNDDGSISETVANTLEKRELNEDETHALFEFFDHLLKHAIIIRDLSKSNIVLQRKNGKIKAYLIDGFGNSDFLPFVKYSETLARKKILRKIGRTFRNLDYHWKSDTEH